MTSGGGPDRFEGLTECPATTVRSGVGHGVEEVGDTDDSCFEWDCLPGDSIGIARAVPPLVVAPGDSLGNSHQLGSTLLEHLRADRRMRLHDGSFLRGKGARLEQN